SAVWVAVVATACSVAVPAIIVGVVVMVLIGAIVAAAAGWFAGADSVLAVAVGLAVGDGVAKAERSMSRQAEVSNAMTITSSPTPQMAGTRAEPLPKRNVP